MHNFYSPLAIFTVFTRLRTLTIGLGRQLTACPQSGYSSYVREACEANHRGLLPEIIVISEIAVRSPLNGRKVLLSVAFAHFVTRCAAHVKLPNGLRPKTAGRPSLHDYSHADWQTSIPWRTRPATVRAHGYVRSGARRIPGRVIVDAESADLTTSTSIGRVSVNYRLHY